MDNAAKDAIQKLMEKYETHLPEEQRVTQQRRKMFVGNKK